MSRLPKPYGLLINRDKPLTFTFENKNIDALDGDTIASALVAQGQWLMSRSFKYHRARGPLTMAGQDANTLVQLPVAPNTLADKQLVTQGLEVVAQNVTGSLNRDMQSVFGLFSRFLPVGFYYKAFYRPKGVWEYWAKFLRKQAGLGKINQHYVPSDHHEEYYDKQYLFADVAIVGGGPAGLSAALAAAEKGVEVLLIEENAALGGSLNYARFGKSAETASALREALLARIEATGNIKVMTNAVCNSWHADNWMAVVSQRRLYKLRADQLVICTGSIEQQAIFRGNDIPGVVMSSAAQRLMHLYAVKPGESALVLTGNDNGYAVGLDLLDAGVNLKAIVDMRESPLATELSEAAMAKGVQIIANSTVYEALIHPRSKRLKGVEVRSIVGQGQCGSDTLKIECDLLCMSVGFMPTYQLVCQAGGQLSYNDDTGMFSLNKLPENLAIAGSVNGKWDLQTVTKEGRLAGVHAASHILSEDHSHEVLDVDAQAAQLNVHWPMFAHPKGKEFVDYDEDLQIADIINATRDGYEHIQLVKRYSTCGMGPSQGRHSALATARLVADATGKTVAQTGVTTARPPFAGETLGHNAGRSFYPDRRSNIHYRHVEAGAQMMLAGAWYRPAYYGQESEREQVIEAEVRNVRSNVGIVDVSTLGGIEVRGPDAAEFLNRFYTFAFVKQEVGKARYVLLINEAGAVIDDGVACRLHEQHYYVTATTGGVDRVFQSMLKWNAQWGLGADIANVTTAWCGVNIAGPKSRSVLEALCEDVDLSATAFPYMGVREGLLAGIPARLIRVGFVGELGYEIHVPQQYGEALWDRLMEAGQSFDISPFGVEAQRVLRLEKGHVIIGQDTDAMSNPMELQMSWALARKKPFFVGARTIRELESTPQGRVLVGFSLPKTASPIPLESQLILEGQQMVGRVTSCSYSTTLDKIIGMAYVPISSAAAGSRIKIKGDGGVMLDASVEVLPFYDPDNQRQEL